MTANHQDRQRPRHLWRVRSDLDDPRKIPYLLVWKREGDGKIMEAVRLTCHADPYLGSPRNQVELKRADGSTTVLRICLANTATQRRAGALPVLPLLQFSETFRLWLGVGQLFRMVEQGTAGPLVLSFLQSAALLFRRRCACLAWGTNLPTPEVALSRYAPPAPRAVAPLRVYLDR